MKKYFLKWVVDDEDEGDMHYSMRVEKPEGDIYAYKKLNPAAGLVRLVEVDENKNETTLEQYVFVNAEKSLEDYGDQLDEDGYRKYLVYVGFCIVTIAKVNPEKITTIDFDEYHHLYDVRHQEWLDAHTAPGGNE